MVLFVWVWVFAFRVDCGFVVLGWVCCCFVSVWFGGFSFVCWVCCVLMFGWFVLAFAGDLDLVVYI